MRMFAAFSLLVACGGGGGGADDDGEVLVGENCPDACVPRCHFVAFSAYADCFPHGTATSDQDLDEGTFNTCYSNGVKEQYRQIGGETTIFTNYKDNEVCFVAETVYDGEVGFGPIAKMTLRGQEERLLEVIEFPNPNNPDLFNVTCGGMVRTVDLTVNATNPDCEPCPEYVFAAPENPDPPSEPEDGVCTIP